LLWFLPIFRPDVPWSEEKLPHRVMAVPLTAVRIDKTRPSGLPNRTVRFFLFQTGAYGSYPIRVAAHFGDFTGESIFSNHGSLRDGDLQQ
jgi:hypothetical protein